MSALAAIGVLGLWLIAPLLNVWNHHISINSEFHIGLHASGDGRFLVLFSSEEFGPLFSVITDVNHGSAHTHSLVLRDVCWNRFGVFYRYISNKRGFAGWTLAVNLMYPFLLFSIIPVISVLSRYSQRHSSPLELRSCNLP